MDDGPGLQGCLYRTGVSSASCRKWRSCRAFASDRGLQGVKPSRSKPRVAEWVRFKQTRLPQLNQQLRDANLAPIAIAEIEQQVEFLMSR